jgi:hypothetical protein
MKLIIKSNPEIVIEVDSAKEEKEIELGSVVPVTKIEPEPKPAAKRGRPKGGSRCSNCGKTGHLKPTCPKSKPSKNSDPFDNDLADKIEGMKDEGFSAQYIADDLRLPLETVKRYY